MATKRRRNLLSTRRRVEDEGDDDDAPVDGGDDSQSEASELTVDDTIDADDSDVSDSERRGDLTREASAGEPNGTGRNGKKRKNVESAQVAAEPSAASGPSKPAFDATADVERMVNGLQISDATSAQDAVDFEDTAEDSLPADSLQPVSKARFEANPHQTMAQRRIAEHEEYKAKRDADPSFVPNRGGFFMHDQRANGTFNPGTGAGRGRGRGRGVAANGHQQTRVPPLFAQGSAVRWDHDLHETVIEPKHPVPANQGAYRQPQTVQNSKGARAGSMSRSTAVGAVLVRVFLPNMPAPVNIDKKLTVKQHTMLPDLRPPLRRDKPVRVSLPEQTTRYIFPSVERSFIFIPRNQRPNQQRTRSRNRGYHVGSRRTSVFGGSNYSPSVAMSRRSSQAQDGLASPAGSTYARPPPGVPTASSRPVVKLPTAPHSQQGVSPASGAAVSASGTPFASLPHGSAYPLPSQPTFREHRSSQMTMHQPRPQKQVSVATIESPDQVSFHAPQQQEHQPFHHQVPMQYGNPPMDPSYYSQMGHMQVHGFPNGNTPLSNIPEGAINAQPFQPGLVPQANYYPYSYQQPIYYYPQPPPQPADGQQNQFGGSQVASPVYIPQGQYFMPMLMPVAPTSDDAGGGGGAQAGMYAHESNGAVYYYDPSQMVDGTGAANQGTAPSTGGEGYFQPASSEVFYYGQ